jgi:hypothetical protein
MVRIKTDLAPSDNIVLTGMSISYQQPGTYCIDPFALSSASNTKLLTQANLLVFRYVNLRGDFCQRSI